MTAADFFPDEEGEKASQVDHRHCELAAMLTDATMLHTLPPREPLVEGLLDRDSTNWRQGKSGAGKSFVALDLCAHVALGREWRGRTVHQGSVLYVIAEGATGAEQRVMAWQIGNQKRLDPSMIAFLPHAVQLLNAVDVEALCRIVADLAPVLIVIDTQARVTVGAEENSSKDMGRLLAATDRLKDVGRACVLVVHHEARGGQNLRGSTAMEGGAAAVLRVVKDGAVVTLTNPKQKDGAEVDPIAGSLEPAGDSVFWSQNVVGLMQASTDTETKIVAVMWVLFETTGVSSTQLLLAVDVPRSSFFRGLGSLLRKGILRNTGTQKRPFYVVSDREEQLPGE